MADKMVLLAIYGNPVEAELARAELEAEGIRAGVMGATSGDLFAGMGVGMSNVQLFVPEADYERASELLAEESEVAREARENREREQEEEERRRATAIKRADAASSDLTDIRPAEAPDGAEPPAAAIREPVAGEEGRETDLADPLPDDDEREPRSLTWTADHIATRAFRAALFSYFLWMMGLVLYFWWWVPLMSPGLPFLLAAAAFYLYAIYLMLRLPSAEGELSPAGMRRAYAALGLILLPPLVGILIAWSASW